MHPLRRFAPALTAGLLLAAVPAAQADSGASRLFMARAVEHPGGTVTLPLHRGTSGGDPVLYVVLDSSDGNDADRLGSNRADKLGRARGSSAVMRVRRAGGVLDFPASVDFRPERLLDTMSGFPPAAFAPGAVGERANGAEYSPLIQLPSGVIENAPQIARDRNHDGRIAPRTEAADKVVASDLAAGTVTLRETDGFARGRHVRYVSTEASDPLAAALEDATLAPALDAAPFAGGDGTDSARASLAAFVNGRTGADDPERQGLNSAVADGLDPLNVLAWLPDQGRYSPLWDVHLAAWSPGAVAAGAVRRQVAFADVEDLAEAGQVTAPGGGPFGASRIVVDCPIVSAAG